MYNRCPKQMSSYGGQEGGREGGIGGLLGGIFMRGNKSFLLVPYGQGALRSL